MLLEPYHGSKAWISRLVTAPCCVPTPGSGAAGASRTKTARPSLASLVTRAGHGSRRTTRVRPCSVPPRARGALTGHPNSDDAIGAVMGGSRFPGGLPRVLWTGPAPWPSGTCKRGRAAMVGETACVDSPRARRCPGAGHGYPRVGRIRSVRSWRWGMTRRPRRSPLGRARSPWNRRLARRGRGNRAAWHGTRPAPRGALIARRSITAAQGIWAAIPRPLAATMSHASK